MGKKIIIATMLVLTLLLLMPSIPAIQHKTIEEGIKQDLQEKLESINLNDLKDIDVLIDVKHPYLCSLIMIIILIRFMRSSMTMLLATEPVGEYGRRIIHPLLYQYGLWLWEAIQPFARFWQSISDILGWGWNINYGTLMDN